MVIESDLQNEEKDLPMQIFTQFNMKENKINLQCGKKYEFYIFKRNFNTYGEKMPTHTNIYQVRRT